MYLRFLTTFINLCVLIAFRRRRNCVECITSASKEKGPGKVRVKFDNGLRIFEDYNFLYVDDPVIGHVESGSGQRGTPKGIPR